MKQEKILITGAEGQIGTALTRALRDRYGSAQVIATDIRRSVEDDHPFEILDILDPGMLAELIERHQVGTIYHLAAILSAKGEKNPKQAWEVNMGGLFNVLEAARERGLQVFFPSSIAVFGDHIPRQETPQYAALFPSTVYGISKVAAEHWCQYYYDKFGVDVRSVRYPGIVGYEAPPGGGTTDYAVEIYHEALKEGRYRCFLSEGTALPMLYMPDAVRATIELMEAPAEQVRIRTSYNLSGMSFTPEQIAASIRSYLPGFEIEYEPDFRQAIADSWPESIDDSQARAHWGWQPAYDLDRMTRDMLMHLQEQYEVKVVSSSS